MRIRSALLFFMLLPIALSACSAFAPSPKERKAALDDFIYALRWQRYQEAALFFTREHRDDFLDRTEELAGLNITDVRVRRINQSPDGRQADVRLEVDYYLLPSATLKTLQVNQTWVYFETPDTEGNGFMITTAFPEASAWTWGGRGTVPP